jgi:hypothetical protein
MWRVFSVTSVVAAAGVAMWPGSHSRRAPSPVPEQQENGLVEVMHYGGNLICHDRFRSDIVGSGNNLLGRRRVETMNSTNRPLGR